MTTPLTGRVTIANSTDRLPEVREFLVRMVHASLLPASEENKIVLAVDEAVANIIEHGYNPEDKNATIEVEVTADERSFVVLVADHGRSFDPTKTGELDIEQHVKTGKKKGLGIFLMRRIMDEVIYDFQKGGRNELRLVKRIPGRPDLSPQDRQASAGEHPTQNR